MWALPDINRLNAIAVTNRTKLKREAARKRKPNCERCECFSRKRTAEVSFLIYDIFSDDPKDVLHLCEPCVGQSGDPWEGYFTCESCQRVMAENYTWELYRVEIGDRTLCLKCAAEEHFANAENWIDPRLVRSVELTENSPLFDAATGLLNPAKCRHVLGVKQPVPAGIRFVENFEFDSTSGDRISGGDMLATIQQLDQPFCPVLDAAYQFAVSIGIYIRNGAVVEQEAA